MFFNHILFQTGIAMVIRTFGQELRVNTTTAGGQNQSAIAGLAGGGFVVLWTDGSTAGGDGASRDVRMQVFDAVGNLVGTEVLANSTTSDDQIAPRVTALADGGFAVVWTDASQTGADTSSLSVRARFFNADGTARGADAVVNTSVSSFQFAESIAALEDGRVVVTFGDGGFNPGDTSEGALRRVILAADGLRLGNDLVVPTSTAGDQSESDITALAGGGYVVTWRTSVATMLGTSERIMAAMFDEFGQRIGTDLSIDGLTGTGQTDTSVTALVDGGFVVAWTETSTSGADTSGTTVRAQVVNGNGTRAGDSFVLPTTVQGNQNAVRVAGLPDGRFVAVWQDFSETGEDFQFGSIKGQVFNPDGSRVGGQFLVNREVAGTQIEPAISVLADGRFVVSWTNGGFNPDVRAQIFDARDAAVSLLGRMTADDLVGTGLADTLSGSFGDDTLYGGNGGDQILGDEGSDILFGGGGVDMMFGGDGNDLMRGHGGADRMFGDAGNDTLTAGAGGGLLSGGAGVDQARFAGLSQGVTVSLVAGAVNGGGATGVILQSIEDLTGSARADHLTGNQLANLINAGDGNDTVLGSAGDDTLIGRDGADALFGGLGNDVLTGGEGGDTLDGGDGIDTVVYEAAQSIVGVVVNLTTPAQNTGEALGDSFVSIENVTGTRFADTLTGNAAANQLIGGVGSDLLSGDGGADRLVGGAGNDTLVGGSGADQFVFESKLQSINVDSITDYSVADDTVVLENAIFTGLAAGTLAATAFVVGGQATTAAHRILYDQVNGVLYFDPDGVGGLGRLRFAFLDAGLSMTAAEFQVI